ncbi:PREDICTED: UPF0725 protein At3g44770-like [Camelina sativa]|uniref:UPF0725 protein At3g44770-like n=1 Tax=Camelina sativa TaxID=90675 RepID=A0ABM0XG86_CAMSA|nr:PREDICTED: UPF0725 protein At3g44770-like [Camelina sativa]
MADTLRRMLESGKLTDEQCLSMLRVLDSDDKVVGRCTCQKVIEEKAVKRIENRKPLTQLLDMRNLSAEESYNLLRQIEEEEGEEEEELDERYPDQILDSQFFDIDRDVRVPRLIGVLQFYFGDKEEEQPPPEMVLYGQLAVHWFNFEHNRNLKFIRLPKLNTQHPFSVSYYITVEVEDEDEDVNAAADSSPSSLTLQTMVKRPFGAFLEAMMEVMIEVMIEVCV